MYECHITIDKPSTLQSIHLCEELGHSYGWKTSFIDGDPVLGKKVFFYFTRHSATYESLFVRMRELADYLDLISIVVVRLKIEHIVYDTKTGVSP